MKHRLILLITLFLGYNLNAQTTNDILKNVYTRYSSPSTLGFDTSYDLYKTNTSKEAYQSYQGVFFKNEKNDVYIKIKDTEILNNKEASLKISHPEKMVLITDPELTISNDMDVSKLLDFYKEESLNDLGSYWELKLLANQPTLPYSKVVLHISKDYLLKKQVFYYSNGVNFSKDYKKADVNTPRLEVSYSNYSKESVDKNKFNTAVFLEMDKAGKVVLNNTLKGYEVLDKRQGLN